MDDISSCVFFDPVCQKPYDTEAVQRSATGGTEASVTRIADALGAVVMQHNRSTAHGRYRPPQSDPQIRDVVIIRDPRGIFPVRSLFPQARVHLWIHHYFPLGSKLFLRLAASAPAMREAQATIVCVSRDQQLAMQPGLHALGLEHCVKTRTIYNPVDDALAPDGSPIDDRKLVFFSSPNKGLKFTLDAFRELRRCMSDLRLVVGNPGYKVRAFPPIEGVQYLAPQPQQLIHAEVRTALCVFYPNFVFPETFGLVLAESKALGTPSLTHNCGAAGEVLGDPRQLLPLTPAHYAYELLLGKFSSAWRSGPARLAAHAGLFDHYVERIRDWRRGDRPTPAPDPRFRTSSVVNEWRALLARP